MALMRESVNLAAAYAMERVAEPAPALALTTSVPASWIRSVRAFRASASKETAGLHWEIRGMMVTPACPPTTGQLTLVGSMFFILPMKALDLTTSRVVTPKIFLGSRHPAFL